MKTHVKIARSLALTCRYGGNVKWFSDLDPRFYSVAEHTVHMIRQARHDDASVWLQRMIWLHDAPEYIIGDLLPVIKKHPQMSRPISGVEDQAMHDLCVKLGVLPTEGHEALRHAAVKFNDEAITAAEAACVAAPQDGWEPYDENNRLHHAFAQRIERAHTWRRDPSHWCRAMIAEFENLFMRKLP